jgi:taurine dioxygenase
MALTTRILTDSLGVEITGIDLSKPVAPSDRDTMQQALDDHLVMVIRDQKLDPAQYLAAARLFGDTMEQHLSDMLMDAYREIAVLDSRQTTPGPDGRVATLGSRDWHTDHTNHARPPNFTLLYAIALPRSGGDTQFANMQHAYAALPEAMRDRLATLKTVNRIEDHDYVTAEAKMRFGTAQVHPLVRTHPVSGRKGLYFHPGKTDQIKGMGHDESLVFLNDLLDRIIQPAIVYRHKWCVGDMLLCDNRAVLHIAVDDYDHAEGRVMHRILIAGDAPY